MSSVASSWTFRRASNDDVELLVTAIREAERSGTPRGLYERVFDLSTDEIDALLRQMLAEDLPGSELSVEAFLVASTPDGTPAGCIATWIEGQEGPSHMVRATLLASCLGAVRWRAAQERLRALAPLNLARTAGALQIEAVYTAPAFRGRGATQALIGEAIRALTSRAAVAGTAEIQSVIGNQPSARAFEKSGFAITERVTTTDPEVLALFPGHGRLKWARRWG